MNIIRFTASVSLSPSPSSVSIRASSHDSFTPLSLILIPFLYERPVTMRLRSSITSISSPVTGSVITPYFSTTVPSTATNAAYVREPMLLATPKFMSTPVSSSMKVRELKRGLRIVCQAMSNTNMTDSSRHTDVHDKEACCRCHHHHGKYFAYSYYRQSPGTCRRYLQPEAAGPPPAHLPQPTPVRCASWEKPFASRNTLAKLLITP